LQTGLILSDPCKKNKAAKTIFRHKKQFLTSPTIRINPIMKKLVTAVLQRTQPISKPLLLASFGAGYLLATILFIFYGNQLHNILQSLFY